MEICCSEVKVNTKIRDKATPPQEKSAGATAAEAGERSEVANNVGEIQQQISGLSADINALADQVPNLINDEITALKHYIDCAISRDRLIKRP